MNDKSSYGKSLVFEKLKLLERRELSFNERIKIKKFFQSFFNEYFQLREESNSLNLVNLTKREIEISEFVARGFTNNEISSALEISIKTVEFHLSSVIRKTETSNRTEAMGFLIKNKIINV
tara:strand:+ start:101 stop:463 length:363 start_codon:yes stop_codon:yes gene_type:complete